MKKIGLYDPALEHDSCGVGCVCRLDGKSTHEVVAQSLSLLINLTHRGAAGADADSGDGAGIIVCIPHKFFQKVLGPALPPEGTYGVGMLFLPSDGLLAARARELTENQAQLLGFQLAAWREVPTDPLKVGRYARERRPAVWQAFFHAPGRGFANSDALERGLYVLRKCLEKAALKAGFSQDDYYVPSLSSRTIVYKGMMYAAQLEGFYPELADPLLESPLTVIHQRYSTNTFPSWRLAQPFRALAHNGEINTIKGNRAWLTAREPQLASPLFGEDIKKLFPLIEPESSDSASLDNSLEFLLMGGRSLEHSLTMLLPQAWGKKYPMSANLRGFFEYHAGLMEPWDGPAAVCVTDGKKVAAALDRNGLRPARYSLTCDGLLVFSSEAGSLPLDPERVIEKGSLRPGQMLLAEAGGGRLLKNTEIKSVLARRHPYLRWVAQNRLDIPGFFSANQDFKKSVKDLKFRQNLFGYTREDTEILLAPMAETAREPVGSMGADVPLAVLDSYPSSLFSFFRQQFAQITNPPIDPIREELVMSQMTFIGYNPNILDETPSQARLVKLTHPFLSNDDLVRLINDLKYDDFHASVIASVFPAPEKGAVKGASLEKALDTLADAALQEVEKGAKIIVISDRDAGLRKAYSVGERNIDLFEGLKYSSSNKTSAMLLPIPSLLAVAAVNQKLSKAGKRVSVGLVCETGDALEVSHMAMLLSLGASAINPYLAYETVADLALKGLLKEPMSPTMAVENYVMALRKGLLKIMSKMGISTLRGYRGAQIFEAVGLGKSIMDKYFPGIPSRVGGLSLYHFEEAALLRYASSEKISKLPLGPPPEVKPLPLGGSYRYRQGGIGHLWTPESVTTLQEAVRTGNYELYKKYAAMINDQSEKAYTLRGQLDFVPAAKSLPLEEVEPIESIVKTFATGAMSFGSLSKEAHETMALAMNTLGARSNSGEGGEDPARYLPRPDGRSTISAVKQVASGRFGVTIEYLAHAKELQIKIAQGAKPGEGGQLPGHKVDTEIARVRHSTPGVTLISPPPHHDIYSIEDIAQLIYDLHQAADEATVCVKLVSEVGVGTIAAGVAKAMAESILISGFDGGTGASPLSSIRHAGSPWEIGLSETQQTLVLNKLRTRVRLQVDGQLKTGRDVAIACLMGADEFGFATSVLISMGCLMMRKCHTNGCPVGIATQDPKLRARFRGTENHVMNYFRFVAAELREYMSLLGFRTLKEMTGNCDRLTPKKSSSIFLERGLDFSHVLHKPENKDLCFQKYMSERHTNTLDDKVLEVIQENIESASPVKLNLVIKNTDRTVGAKISSRIVRRYGLAGLPDDTITLNLEGIAGQSFGAFASKGLTLTLYGEANDYTGKGLSGGKLIVRPPMDSHPGFEPEENTICGNVTLYGATSGELYLNGLAGERFAVRNSGAIAVVEGVGDHGCEYMTGGRVVVLGKTGVNFGAGMSGGMAYVLDSDGYFDVHVNHEMVNLELLNHQDEEELIGLIRKHLDYTGSKLAYNILADWPRVKNRFVKVFPLEYRAAYLLERGLGRSYGQTSPKTAAN
ncbi:MAG: glutamate synthase subunit alpha [Deltaproteobacteria bacterium]|jgi:glutamate synthase domain-containing protein 2/glutamate synthase domain-containing protein 1/glutamate synthase domain-containing protein 3|nr:glutamate synthase subunit alpha [Deltaproteobacteria bacterium]